MSDHLIAETVRGLFHGGMGWLLAFVGAVLSLLLHRMWREAVKARAAMRDVASLKKDVAEILEHVGPNGGKSIKDQVTRIELQLTEAVARLSAIDDDSSTPGFEVDVSSRIIHVNKALTDLLECSAEELIGREWLNLVRRDARIHVISEFQHALNEERSFAIEDAIFVGPQGADLHVTITARPLIVRKGVPVLWRGLVQRRGKVAA